MTMTGMVTMNKVEQRTYGLVLEVLYKRMTIGELSLMIGKSYRQCQRILKKVEEKQIQGIKHGNSNRSPINKTNLELKGHVVKLLRERYFDFNMTHFREKLLEVEGISINRETLRKWCHEVNLVKRVRRRGSNRVHKPRPRMPQAGMLVQFDGSEHDWFSGAGPTCTLIGGIDDATGEVLNLEFFAGEDLFNCMTVMQTIIEKYGVPQAFYLDQAGYFGKSYREHDSTQIGRALSEVGSRIILAHSPQAKGKIERLWGTLQDRLVAELRLNNINRIPAANLFLKETFTADYNRRFSVQARESQSSFKTLITGHNLKDIFCIKELRKISPGNTFSYNELGHFVINEKQDLRYRSVVIRQFADFTTDYEVYGQKVTVTHLGKRKIKPLAA
jgi:transposase InsO family protein